MAKPATAFLPTHCQQSKNAPVAQRYIFLWQQFSQMMMSASIRQNFGFCTSLKATSATIVRAVSSKCISFLLRVALPAAARQTGLIELFPV
jgi:hypothetical protein